jgi:parallel beta-helix repeat protein
MDKAGNSSLKVTKPYSVIAATEEPAEEPGTVYPQKWATGTGTVGDPWANNCLNSAYTACPVGGTIYLKAGYYKIDTYLEVGKSINIIGEGMGRTFIIISTGASGENYGIYVNNADYVTLKGFTIDGSEQGDNTKSCIYINLSDYITVEDVEAKNGGGQGIDYSRGNYSSFHNIYTYDNYEHGVHGGVSATGQNIKNTYRDIYSHNNGSNGFDDFGYDGDTNNNVYDNLQCWDNGDIGIALVDLKDCVLSNSSVNSNGGRGIYISLSENISVNNCFSSLSEEEGIGIYDSDDVSFTNVVSKSNNGECGIYINNSNGLKFTSCQSYDDRVPPIQRYGIVNGDTSTTDYIELTDCILMPNKIASIYNDSGAVIAIITEKMLAKL